MSAERECGCPPWVIRCAHWEGQLLWLVDRDAGLQSFGIGTKSMKLRYDVALGTPIDHCAAWPGCTDHVTITPTKKINISDPGAAHAEFVRQEALLLGREVPA